VGRVLKIKKVNSGSELMKTDKEITDIIAEKVMEYTKRDMSKERGFNYHCTEEWFSGDAHVVDGFYPLTNDADCMMAWDKLAETRHLHIHVGYSEKHKGQYCECWFGNDAGMAVYSRNVDRRRAMCECMINSVSE